jgi:hypothetical protein
MIVINHLDFLRNKIMHLETGLLSDLNDSEVRFPATLVVIKSFDDEGNITFKADNAFSAFHLQGQFYGRMQLFNRRCNYYSIAEGDIERNDDSFVMKCRQVYYYPSLRRKSNNWYNDCKYLLNWLLSGSRSQISQLVFTLNHSRPQ